MEGSVDGETEKLHKYVKIKVIVGDKTFLHQFRAPATRGYSVTDIEEMLERIIEHLDQKFPILEFKQVDLLPNVYNFIAVGTRPRPGASNEVEKRNDAGNIQDGVSESGTSDRRDPIILTDVHDDHPTAKHSGATVPASDDSDVSFVRGDS